eukprot:39313-Rhodomonas_salina.3
MTLRINDCSRVSAGKLRAETAAVRAALRVSSAIRLRAHYAVSETETVQACPVLTSHVMVLQAALSAFAHHDVRYSLPEWYCKELSAYARPTQCPVLTQRAALQAWRSSEESQVALDSEQVRGSRQ